MKQISKMAAWELDDCVRGATGDLKLALMEVDRLRDIVQYIISKVATFPNRPNLSSDKLLEEIEDIAQRYFDG